MHQVALTRSGGLDRLTHLAGEAVAHVAGVRSEGDAAEVGVGDEDAHLQIEPFHLPSDGLLLLRRAPLHAVVLEGGEALIRDEPQLFEWVVTGAVAEHVRSAARSGV